MKNKIRPLNIQVFAESDGGSDGAGIGSNGNAADNNANNQNADNDKAKNNVLSSEAIKKLIQSEVDKRTADYGKQIANLKSENSNLKKAVLSHFYALRGLCILLQPQPHWFYVVLFYALP